MKPDEERVANYLAERSLSVAPFPNEEINERKTPDFSVQAGGAFAFYCEVKSIMKSNIEGMQNDPVFNRLTDDVHKAVKQLDSVNSLVAYPNVLAFVNHDKMCGFLDLIAVFTGTFISEKGELHPIYRKFSEGRIKDEKARVHAVVWLDDFKPERILFTQTHPEFHQKLCEWFGIQPSEIKQIGAQAPPIAKVRLP